MLITMMVLQDGWGTGGVVSVTLQSAQDVQIT